MSEAVQLLLPARAVAFPASAADRSIETGSLWVTGWSIKESTGAAPAECWLMDGGDVNGSPVAFVTLLAGQSVRDLVAQWPLQFQVGVWLHVVAGSVQGAVWVIDPPIGQ